MHAQQRKKADGRACKPPPRPHLRRLQCDLDVAARERQREPGALVRDKVQRHLRVALLLQVGDEGGPAEPPAADEAQDVLKAVLWCR